MSNKRKECYVGIFNKIDHIEDRINEIKEQIANLKQGLLGEKYKKSHTTKLETTKTPIDTKAPGDA